MSERHIGKGLLRPLVLAGGVMASGGCDELVGLAPPSDAGPPPLRPGQLLTVASGQGSWLSGIAADVAHVYWTTKDSVQSVAVNGGVPTTLAREPDAMPIELAVDTTHVYWLGNSTSSIEGVVMKVPLQGGTPVTLATAKGEPNFMAVDATSVYWTMGLTQAGGCVMKVGLDGGTPTVLASGSGPFYGVAVDALNAYYVAYGASSPSLMKVPLDGGQPVTLASSETFGFGNIYVNSSNVYWAAGSGIMSVSVGGGEPTTLASGQTNLSNIVLDSSRVYWIDQANCGADASETPTPCDGVNGSVMSIPPSGGAATTLFSGPELVTSGGLAVGGSGLFWTSPADNGSVMKCDGACARARAITACAPPAEPGPRFVCAHTRFAWPGSP